LEEFGFRHRKAQRVKTMGESADRDTQFRKIAQLRAQYLKAGLSVGAVIYFVSAGQGTSFAICQRQSALV
jgi:hypothetical protein